MSARAMIELQTIDEFGNPPESRLKDAVDVVNLVNRLVEADTKRDKFKAIAKGLFDGNPPFKRAALVKSGQSYRTNTNWRIAESFLNIALTAYWDVVSEGPSLCTIDLDHDNEAERQEWNGIVNEEFQRLNLNDNCLNYMFQTSQYYMVMFGCGPVIWDHVYDYRAQPVANVMLPDGTKSDVNEWEIAAVPVQYRADELFNFIRDPVAAAEAGWNVEVVRKALMMAFPARIYPNGRPDWMWLQERIRNNDLTFSTYTDKIEVCHVYYKEFPSKTDSNEISHCIVQYGSTAIGEFLFRKIRRFPTWTCVINPMYYDIGDGTHHSVKGLGIKAYGAMDAYNRLQCAEVDYANFQGSMHLQMRSENAREAASVVEMGPFKVWPAGFDFIPNNSLGQNLQAMADTRGNILNTLVNNLAQYRQGMTQKSGNPVTARQIDYEAENQSVIGRTQLSRYFDQLDEFWKERYIRIIRSDYNEMQPGGRDAVNFRKRCKDRGVPMSALGKTRTVRATRTIGWGSPYTRRMALTQMLSTLSLYPDIGKQRIIEDLTATTVGHSLMRRYIPEASEQITDDHVLAALQVAGAKTGVAPVMPPDADNEVFAKVFMAAAMNELQSVTQGANPIEVLKFCEIIGPAIAQHIQKLESGSVKKDVAKNLMDQFKQFSQLVDQLRQKVQQGMQQQVEQQQKMQQAQMIQQGVDPDTQIKAATAAKDMQLKEAKAVQQMQLKAQKTQQDMAVKDLQTAQAMRQSANEDQSE